MSVKSSNTKLVMLGVFLLSLIVCLLVFSRTELLTPENPQFNNNADHHKYIYMAMHPFEFRMAPYCWRILVPTLVYVLSHLTSLPHQTIFQFLSILGVAGTGWALYLLARLYGFGAAIAFAGMLVFYTFGWATKFVLGDFWLPDPVSFLFITLLFCAIAARTDTAFVILLLCGVLVKESILFVAPAYYSLNSSKVIDWGLMRKTLLLSAPAIATLIAIRLVLPALNGDVAYVATLPDNLKYFRFPAIRYDYWEILNNTGIPRLRTFSFGGISLTYFEVFGVFGIVLPVFAVKRNLILLAKYSPYVVLVMCQLLFALETQRYVVMAFIPLVLMCLNGIVSMKDWTSIPGWSFLIPIAIVLITYVWLSPLEYVPPYRFGVTILILFLAFVIQLKKRTTSLAS
jgi:hypothetical protein